MIWLEGVGFRHFGGLGLLGTDAVFNVVVFGIVAAVFVARKTPASNLLQVAE